ncbi:hypothetical protein Q4602_10555 [Paraglaciecola chathamensis]|uniref:hypothetical protein n=1 Tax=Paraglaciecola chathamensis TaxID=368405 RepID=UPI0027117EE9|nr:hypothetical protein [Paraglaciecola chathamensis]MDO6839910.1 hypothetical protein [Paraglaciecola chathamensis]
MRHQINNSNNEPTSNPLGNINARFHSLYGQQKSEIINQIKQGDVLLVCRMDNRLIVKCGGTEEAFTINTTRYHDLKALSHSTLAVYYSLLNTWDKETLKEVDGWINEIRSHEPKELSQELADVTAELVTHVRTAGALTHSDMSQYQQALEPIYAKLMTQAAKDEIESLVSTLNAIREQYNYPSSKMFMIVFGGHQPRYKALASMVFKRWFSGLEEHTLNSDHHVRYCEGGESLDDAIELVASAILDKDLAKSTLGSALALNRDVLSLVAQRAIDDYWRQHNLR